MQIDTSKYTIGIVYCVNSHSKNETLAIFHKDVSMLSSRERGSAITNGILQYTKRFNPSLSIPDYIYAYFDEEPNIERLWILKIEG